ncbi:MAG: hypothetical protein NTV49_10490 [Kiritimatiellaeota bacterium]|nr:hypothetical protein [Kiritimatiellota bacterium]
MRAPDRQRFLDAVAHHERPDVPLFEMEADILVVERMLGKRCARSLHSFELPIEDVVEWNRRMGNDMVYFSHVWHLGRREQTDADGRLHYADGTMKTREALERITFPDLDALRRRLDALCAAIDGTGFGLVCGSQNAGFTVPTAIGYQDFCLTTILDPGFILDFQKRVHEYAMTELEALLQYPVDAVKIASGLITSTGSMISPEMLEQFEFPWMSELAARVKESGRSVLFHVDGDVSRWVERFLEMGADILNPIDPSAANQSIYDLKKIYGKRLALCGNINVGGVLCKGTPEEVAADVRAHIDRLAPGGGYIVASSHDLHQDIPVRNVYAMRDATTLTALPTRISPPRG